ncbi:MAG TPA: FtsX-like permease family protein [Candidatus Thalassarchaeaceae archaeon]|nr:FtsX-like permease family protein [Candidatus Thalassarchaeaceae archaeon]
MNERLLSMPDNFVMAAKSAWRGRERGLAIFAGVFLASLVITTVLAYSVGLSQAFLQYSLENDTFDAKVDFADEPNADGEGRTNDSVLWESLCDEFVVMDEFSDCGIVYGRQGIRWSGAWGDDGFVVPQPLNVISASGSTGDWTNVSWDYPEAGEFGPPINQDRIVRFYGDGVWDGELGERHAKQVLYGSWPLPEDAASNRSILLPLRIASQAGVSVNDTIDSLTFTYVTGYLSFENINDGFDDCQGEEVIEQSGYMFCRVNMTVENLKVAAVLSDAGAGNPTLLFNPLIISDSVLSDEQKLILMDNDHGYLGIAVDRNLVPTSSTDNAQDWLSRLKSSIEASTFAGGTDAQIEVEYNDLISSTIGFLEFFLALIQLFDYILMIPIVILSFSVLIYGLILSLEQRKREISIHRVIGGSERGLTRMVMLEVTVFSIAAWLSGYLIAMLSVPLVLDAVGFMEFRATEIDVNPVLSLFSTIFTVLLTVGLAYLFGFSKTKEFLNIEIDEGVRKVSANRKPRYWLHTIVFIVGLLAFTDSWIESSNPPSEGIVTGFFYDGIIKLVGPFCLWIGGALVLGRIGAAGPKIFSALLSWSPAISDIKRGLRGSGSSESVSRLAVIMLLTLSIVTLAAVQGYTGTVVDERTASAQSGADIQVQFAQPVTEQEAITIITEAIIRADDPEVQEVQSATAVSSIFTNPKGEGAVLTTWIVFDGHEDTLHWDKQSVPGDDIDVVVNQWSENGFTAGEAAVDILDIESDFGKITGGWLDFTFEYKAYDWYLGPDSEPVITVTVTEVNLTYMGKHEWVPGFGTTETEQSLVVGEKTYRQLVGDSVADSFSSSRWFFELCDQTDDNCGDALRTLNAELTADAEISSVTDWSTTHRDVERNGGLIFGTPGLLSLQFVVASLASVASAFVFLSLVLTQRKRELAILQAIGASSNQVIRLVLFEILSIILVSMAMGVALGLAVAESFNGFFKLFGFIFQLLLGQSTTISRDLVWPWLDLGLVNLSVLIAVVLALLYTTRRALQADLAVVLKGE